MIYQNFWIASLRSQRRIPYCAASLRGAERRSKPENNNKIYTKLTMSFLFIVK